MNFVEIFGLLLIGFVVGLFSPVKMAMRFGVRHSTEDKASLLAKRFQETGQEDLAKICEQIASGHPIDQVIAGMPSDMRKRYEAFREATFNKRKEK